VSKARSNALHTTARVALAASDFASLERIARELEKSGLSAGDQDDVGFAHYYLGVTHFWRGDRSAAEDEYRKGLEIFKRLQDREGIAEVMVAQAAIPLHFDLDAETARHRYEAALPAVRQTAEPKLLAIALGRLGEVCHYSADYESALGYAMESANTFLALEMPASAGVQFVNVAHVHTLRREYAAARDAMRRARDCLWQKPTTRRVAYYLEMCVTFTAALHQWETAARLLAFVNRYRYDYDVPRSALPPWFTENVERISARFTTERQAELEREGEALTLEDVPEVIARVALDAPR